MKEWEALAEWFHENREANQTDYYLIQHPALLELIGEVSGIRVLDLGCGPGSLAIALSELGAEVTAIDSSPTMLNIARKDAERNGQRVRFIQGEVKEWEDPEASYDLVTAINLLRYLERRLAKQGGRILLVETAGIPEFERTRDFYRKNGFTEEARIREFYEPGVDKIVFWKRL